MLTSILQLKFQRLLGQQVRQLRRLSNGGVPLPFHLHKTLAKPLDGALRTSSGGLGPTRTVGSVSLGAPPLLNLSHDPLPPTLEGGGVLAIVIHGAGKAPHDPLRLTSKALCYLTDD